MGGPSGPSRRAGEARQPAAHATPALMGSSHLKPSGTTPALRLDWRCDLEASREVEERDKRGFEMVLDWFERWQLSRGVGPEVGTVRRFWLEQVKAKDREEWHLDQ